MLRIPATKFDPIAPLVTEPPHPPVTSAGGSRPSGRRRARAQAQARLRQRYELLKLSHEGLLRQLTMAEQLQRSMLPQSLPQVPGVTFAAAYRPTQHLAGDFYNAFRLDREHLGLYVGDVMGHGPAAALLGVYTMTTLRTKRIEGNRYEILEPGAVLARFNDDLCGADFPGMPFVTLAYGVLDLTRRTWQYCCGGHPHPLIVRDGQPAEWLPPTAPLLGVMEAAFAQRTVDLQPRDRLVLYSDGVLAATWHGHGPGAAGLASALAARDRTPLQEQLDTAMATLSFGDEPADDIAILAVELTD